MDTGTRYIINYRTGEMWQTTVQLFENYQQFVSIHTKMKKLNPIAYSFFDLWFENLSLEGQAFLTKVCAHDLFIDRVICLLNQLRRFSY